jgi:hypothetical protein
MKHSSRRADADQFFLLGAAGDRERLGRGFDDVSQQRKDLSIRELGDVRDVRRRSISWWKESTTGWYPEPSNRTRPVGPVCGADIGAVWRRLEAHPQV